VFERGRLEAGQALLVHGANSGIGVTAIQLAKAAGARVIATARSADKAARARDLGADLAIDAAAGDWSSAVKEAGGADVILDLVGADYFARNLEVLNADGRLVVIATLGGHMATLDLRRLMLRRQTITASTLRARDANEKARLAREVERHVWPWIESGRVRPLVDRTFPLEQAADAHRWLESGTQFGKVVLTTTT
jgi:NADPH:quinone reductase-like Zn-dependent oxidoreductase